MTEPKSTVNGTPAHQLEAIEWLKGFRNTQILQDMMRRFRFSKDEVEAYRRAWSQWLKPNKSGTISRQEGFMTDNEMAFDLLLAVVYAMTDIEIEKIRGKLLSEVWAVGGGDWNKSHEAKERAILSMLEFLKID